LTFQSLRRSVAVLESNMAAIHLIERENYFTRVTGSQTEWESGYWAIAEALARELIGGHIYFHEKQQEPSYYGGIINGFRINQVEPYSGRIIFRFEPKPDCRGVRAGREGWQQEKKIVK
jgi:hypothetical protein